MKLARQFVVRTPLLAAMRAGSRRFGRVLLYHRVVDARCHPCIGGLVRTAVTRAAFERQLDYLARHYRVVDLATLMRGLDNPADMVAITFDDGYADNLHQALPALRERGMPATIFAVAGFVGANRRAWWDRLARLTADNGPHPLRLDSGGSTFEAPFPGDSKIQYQAASHWIESLPENEREAVFAGRFVHDDDRFLDVDELRELERHNIRIEAHTVTHPRLSRVADAAAVRDELVRGRAMIGDMIGRPVEFFAYPFGMPGDYDDTTRRMAEQAGYSAAFAAHSGLVRAGGDRFAVPRLTAGEDFDRFRIKVSRWRAAR